jgi:hypothetical protein
MTALKWKSIAAATLGAAAVWACVCGASVARADDDVWFRIGFGTPEPRRVVVEPAPAPGHYETRATQVLVSPGHYEQRWVPGGRVATVDRWGRRVIIEQPGHYENLWIEPVYDTRYEQVWVPDVYVGPRYYEGPYYRRDWNRDHDRDRERWEHERHEWEEHHHR